MSLLFCSVRGSRGLSPLVVAISLPSCLQAPTIIPAASLSSLPLNRKFFPCCLFSLCPDQCLTWMALFSDSFKVGTSALVCLIWIPGVSPPFSSLSQFFTSDPLLAGLMLSRRGWEGAEKLFLLWVLTDVDIAFHQPFYKQAYGSK